MPVCLRALPFFWPETDVKIRNGAAFKYENYHALNVNEVKSSVKLGRDGLVATTRRWRSKIRWNACNHLVVAILKMTIGTSPRYCYSQVLQVVPKLPILVPMTVLYCTSTGTVAPVLVLVPELLQWYCGSATGCYRLPGTVLVVLQVLVKYSTSSTTYILVYQYSASHKAVFLPSSVLQRHLFFPLCNAKSTHTLFERIAAISAGADASHHPAWPERRRRDSSKRGGRPVSGRGGVGNIALSDASDACPVRGLRKNNDD